MDLHAQTQRGEVRISGEAYSGGFGEIAVHESGRAAAEAYDAYMQNMSYQQSMLWSSREEGREEGKHEGKKEGKREEQIAIARNLLAHQVSLELIAASTGLSEQEIGSLLKKSC